MSIEQKRQTERIFPVKPGDSVAPGPRRLAVYAVDPATSRGRLVPEPPSPSRSPYARDRDRILHAMAFRRLNYKTQVFIYHEGDHYRSRLTHSLEVAQIARAIARTLRVDEDLTEALALAHDLGHPPFGHAGERALDAAMSGAGGFDHNAQSLRVVIALEKKFAKNQVTKPAFQLRVQSRSVQYFELENVEISKRREKREIKRWIQEMNTMLLKTEMKMWSNFI